MQKLVLLFGIFFTVVSSQTFGQDSTIKSVHPKMDKYYPRPQEAPKMNNEAATPASPVLPSQRTPTIINQSSTNNTVVSPSPSIVPNERATEMPAIEAGPAVTNTPVTVQPSDTKLNASNSVTAPPSVTVTAPAPKVISKPKAPPEPPYLDTRLGSSSPQYNTWEKNNNGAGSVTTNPKQ
ncbi:MAG: hypothetical protein ACTHM7_05995 [Ginsengibacter sp.]